MPSPIQSMTDTSPKLKVETVDMFEAEAVTISSMQSDLVVKNVFQAANDNCRNDFRLGGLLCRAHDDGLWKDNYESFQEFVESAGLHYRKGMYLMNIYRKLINADIPWDRVKHLGWTKLRELADIITADNLDKWVAIAENSTVVALAEAVKAAKNGASTTEAGEQADEVSTLTFKVHADQRETIEMAVAKAKGELGTEYNTVALEAICMNYLSGAVVEDEKPEKKAPLNLAAILRTISPEDLAEAVDVAYPDIDFTIAL